MEAARRRSLTAALGAAVDKAALRAMTRLWLMGGDPGTEKAREAQRLALELYGRDDLVRDPRAFFPEPPPARVDATWQSDLPGGAVERWRWRSGYRTHDASYGAEYDAHDENQFAHAEVWRHDRPGAPAIICLHSWATGSFALQRRFFSARALYEAGLDVALSIMPFHGPRTPRGSLYGGQQFPGTSPRRTNEAFGQAVWDARGLLGHLRSTGSPHVGVMGMSLGGYTTALLACVEPRLSFAIPMIPMVSLADLLWSHGEGHPQRRAAEERGATLEKLRKLYAVHSPLGMPPRLPRERLMIIAGKGDRVTPPEHVSRLWEHWGRPRIHWFPGSHLLHFGRRKTVESVLDFLNDSLEGALLRRGREDRRRQVLRRNVGPMSIFFPSLDAAARARSPDVLLLQGFGCASGAMAHLARDLESRGLRAAVPSLGGLFGCLQTGGVADAGARLARYIEEMRAPPWIVGHSLGGLIAREAVQRHGARVRGVVTLATPHRGAPWALAAIASGLGWVSRAPFDMLPFSPAIRRLNGTPWPEAVPLYSVVSRADPICLHPFGVLPFARGDEVRSIVLEGLGHTEILRHPVALDVVASLVGQGGGRR